MSAILRIPFASLLLLGAASGHARAADFPVKAPAVFQPQFDWSGFYIGAHTGYGGGRPDTTAFDPSATNARTNYGGAIGGVQAGYNFVLPSRVLLGVEADMSFLDYLDSGNVVTSIATPNAALLHQLDYAGTVRGRIGYAAPNWMIYATAGLAFAGERFLYESGGIENKTLHQRVGWAAGAGIETAIAPQWTARLEYLYSDYGTANVALAPGARVNSALDFQTIRLGLNRKIDIGGVASASTVSGSNPDTDNRWEIWGQSTYLGQGYPAFNAPYSGPNSLTPNAQYKATWSNSLYINARLWDGGEFYFNPELLQGFGLDNTVGLGGFSSGEAQKSNFPYPRFNPSRIYLRQTFGFGGEQETLEGGPSQLSGKEDISRLTLQAGKFAVLDVFDGNAYAKDPRKDFMNWSIWAPGAFDYAADKVGLTYGTTAELNQKNWAFRLGYFLMDAESNSNNFDMKIFSRGEYVAELEQRYMLFGQPGKLRTIGWLNSAFAGSYRETLNDPALNLDISQTRKGRIKYGYVVNLEQAVTDDIGLFGRWSWNDGKTEIMAFTDIDASLSGGASIKGTAWGRPEDVVGIGGAINALSRDHRDFIAAGGLGVLIGDGRLNYSEEKILETYYAIALNKQLTVTADYQYVRNPAYNADRGPASIFSGRLRGEF